MPTNHDPAFVTVAAEPAGEHHSLSVVVPVYDEEAVLSEFHRRLAAVLDRLHAASEIIYVNDGSSDGSAALLASLHDADPRVAVIELSRNFGKEAAMSAGLDHARGDAVVILDADLQHPPECIPGMVEAWQQGFDVVLMRRASRAREGGLRKASARAFYRLIGRIGTIEIPEDVGDFRLLSRRAVLALARFPERSRFMKGLFAWIGYPSTSIDYEVEDRYAGETKWSFWRLWNFALEGITSFSVVPLKIASYVGFATALAAFAYAAYFVGKTMLVGESIRGFPTLVVLILFLGGLQLTALGIIGEYLARMFIEVKQRPLYLVQRRLPPAHPIAAGRADTGHEHRAEPPAL